MSFTCNVILPKIDAETIEKNIKQAYSDCQKDFEALKNSPVKIMVELFLTGRRSKLPETEVITQSITNTITLIFADYEYYALNIEFFFNHLTANLRLQLAKYSRDTGDFPLLIRDPIHKDMQFSKLEEGIIRTRHFQRLHGIKQLGTSYQAYPAALHTRFEHSLGTCWMAKKFMKYLIRRGYQISSYEYDLISVAALLHDITHIPFGHTLEDEYQIFERHDAGKRLDYFLDNEEIKGALGEIKDDVKRILKVKDASNGEYHAPFHVQIINDTICADLCDYLSRDTYFTGLSQNYDLRFLNYLMLDDKHRLVIEIAEGNIIMPDVLTELINLLRLRYILGERVYYHHNKIVFSAMIAKSLEMTLETTPVHEEYFYCMNDEAFLNFLLSKFNKSLNARRLAELVVTRQHHARAYVLSPDTRGINIEKLVANYYYNKENRRRVEKEIAEKIGLKDEDVIIYVSPGKLALKEADALVKTQDDEIKKLSAIDYPEIRQLKDMYEKIWRFYVFLYTHDEDKIKACRDFCKDIIGYKSEYIRHEKKSGYY